MSELNKLVEAISAMPLVVRQDLEPFVIAALKERRKRQETLCVVNEALLQLRVDIKYLLFDLNATRQERDDLK